MADLIVKIGREGHDRRETTGRRSNRAIC